MFIFIALGWSEEIVLTLDRDDLNELAPGNELLLCRKNVMKVIGKYNDNDKVKATNI